MKFRHLLVSRSGVQLLAVIALGLMGGLSLITLSHAFLAVPAEALTNAADTANSDNAPAIQFSHPDLVYDMGVVAQNMKKDIVIKFKNVGKGELVIDKVKPS